MVGITRQQKSAERSEMWDYASLIRPTACAAMLQKAPPGDLLRPHVIDEMLIGEHKVLVR